MQFTFLINDTTNTEIYTLSLHDALPIYEGSEVAIMSKRSLEADRESLERMVVDFVVDHSAPGADQAFDQDRKSTRLNSSHVEISYAVFCLKKKNIINQGVQSYADLVPVL